MALLATVKWILKTDAVSRSEKLVGTGVVLGLNYLAKQASKRGDFHEANHNVMALLAGNSVHEHGSNCVIPHDRLLNAEEGMGLAERLKTVADPAPSTGLYL